MTSEHEPPETTGVEIDDHDSSFEDDSDVVSSTASLDSASQLYTFENGRRYHGFRSGKYVFPNDEGEADREDMKHHATRLMLNKRLHLTEFTTSPMKVLDLGTGTGIWAIDFADENPASQVIGIDLSPIQPTLVPPNLEFQIDDIEDEWTFRPESVDFINIRYMATAIKDWPHVLRQAYKTLKPGGKIELADMRLEYTSDDGTVIESNHLLKFLGDIRTALPRIGIDIDAGESFEPMLLEAGFINIRHEILKLPMGPWPKDRRLKEIGFFHRAQFMQGLEGIAIGVYVRGKGWTMSEVQVMLADVRKAIWSKRVHGYWWLQFTTAERK